MEKSKYITNLNKRFMFIIIQNIKAFFQINILKEAYL